MSLVLSLFLCSFIFIHATCQLRVITQKWVFLPTVLKKMMKIKQSIILKIQYVTLIHDPDTIGIELALSYCKSIF